MENKPMFIAVTKSGLKIRPEGSELLLLCVKYCIKHLQDKITEYHEVSPGGQPERAVVEARYLLSRTQTLSRELEQVQGHIVHVYDRNFQMWADAFCVARIELGLKRIEDSPHLYALLVVVMKMLKEENPLFSQTKFISYNNEGK